MWYGSESWLLELRGGWARADGTRDMEMEQTERCSQNNQGCKFVPRGQFSRTAEEAPTKSKSEASSGEGDARTEA